MLDRSREAQFGISPQLLDDTLYDALGQRQVATIFTNIDQYHVVLEVAWAAVLQRQADLVSAGIRGQARVGEPVAVVPDLQPL